MARSSSGRRTARSGPGAGEDTGVGGRWARRLAWVAGALVFTALIAVFGAAAALRSYLHSDAFRQLAGAKASEALRADGSFGAFSWTDSTATVEGFSARGYESSPVSSLKIEGIRATVDAGAARDGVWEVSRLEVNRVLADTAGERLPGLGPAAGAGAGAGGPGAPGWLRSRLPDRMVVKEAVVHDLGVTWAGGSAEGLRVVVRRGAGGGASVDATGGVVSIPGFEDVRIDSLEGRVTPERVFITGSKGEFGRSAVLAVRGEIERGDPPVLDLTIGFDDLDAGEVLPEDWARRVSGTLSGEVEVSGPASARAESGKITLSDGVIEALPVLDRIADYTRTENFRRLTLSAGEFEFRREGGVTDVHSVILESAGLLRVEGRIGLAAGAADGEFQVGVTPGALRWVPSAEQKVFTREASGYRWATVKVWGRTDDLQQDLVARLVGGAVEGTVESVTESLARLLPIAADDGDGSGAGAAGPGGLPGGELLEGAAGAGGTILETGAGLLKGLLPGSD